MVRPPPEGAPQELARSPVPPGSVVVRQRWHHLTFLHWRYDARDVQRLLPRDVEVEEIDGSAWVGLIPFMALGTRLFGVPAARAYPETNLRTYVRSAQGSEAVWFFSLEASSAPVVLAARASLSLPYHWSVMRAETSPERCRYRSRRRFAPAVAHDVEVVPGRTLEQRERTERHELLTARWRLVVPRTGGRLTVPVHHGPWPLKTAEVVRLDETLTRAAGLPPPSEPPETWWSPGVDAAILMPKVRAR